MTILASRYVFEVNESDGAICFDLWPWPLWNHILGHISVKVAEDYNTKQLEVDNAIKKTKNEYKLKIE